MTRITKHQNNKNCSIIAINTDSNGGEGVSGDFISTTDVIKTKLISDQGKGAILEETSVAFLDARKMLDFR